MRMSTGALLTIATVESLYFQELELGDENSNLESVTYNGASAVMNLATAKIEECNSRNGVRESSVVPPGTSIICPFYPALKSLG